MKVILLKDVRGTGRANDAVTVSDGHALNYLIPNKMAVLATTSALKQADLRSTRSKAQAELDAKLLAQNIATLGESRIVIRAKVNEKGHLYDAIGSNEIVAAVRDQANIGIPESIIRLERPLKEVGTHQIPVAAHDVFGSFPVTVEAE